MKKYSCLLFDADDTILDFHAAQQFALTKTLNEADIPATPENLAIYDEINKSLWRELEKGNIRRETIALRRFELFFEACGIQKDVSKIAFAYTEHLKKCYHIVAFADDVLDYFFKKEVPMYVITNGTKDIQISRLYGSGLSRFFYRCFISEEVGAAKPQKAFFDYVTSHIPDFVREEALVIGDSLSSDILGGYNAGIDTCYINRKQKPLDGTVTPTYVIDSILQLPKIIEV